MEGFRSSCQSIPGRAQPPGYAQPDDPPLGPPGVLPAAVRPAGPVGHPRRAVLAVPGGSPGAVVWDLEPLGARRTGQAQAPGLSQRDITMGPEGIPDISV